MNADSALGMVRDEEPHRVRRRQFLANLRRLKDAGDAAAAAARGRVATWADDRDLRHFLVFKDTPRIGWVRNRLWELVQRRPEAEAPDRGGKDRR
jgi:hypothetical protein